MPFDNCHFRNNSKYGCPAEFGAVMGFVCLKARTYFPIFVIPNRQITFASRKENFYVKRTGKDEEEQ